MTPKAWTAFCAARDRYKKLVDETAAVPGLGAAVQRLVDGREGPSYTVDTPAVYNLALEDITPDSEIKMILVADNPGRREQAAENRRYLVGPSGKIAEKFFRDNPVLGIDFRKNVLILNKTPIHTPRTAELKELCRIGGKALSDAALSSQRIMAALLAEFWRALRGVAGPKAEPFRSGPKRRCPAEGGSGKPAGFGAGGDTSPPIPLILPLIWIIGYSEMKRGGIFEVYTDELKALCADGSLKESVFFYRHFSMNQFALDLKLKRQARPGEALDECLRRIGAAYRERVLG
jgi:hypothetical protein